MVNSKLTVMFDVDDVLLDFVGSLTERYKAEFDPEFHYFKVDEWDLNIVFYKAPKNWWLSVARDPLYFLDVNPCVTKEEQWDRKEMAELGIRTLAVTNTLPLKSSAYSKWVRFNRLYSGMFAPSDYLEVKPKELVYVDYALDDNADTVRALAATGVMAYLRNRPWNQDAVDLDSWRLNSIGAFKAVVMRGLSGGLL